MNVTIAGAGNVGTQLAVHCAEKGCKVSFFTSKAEKIQHKLQIVDQNGRVTHQGAIHMATDDPQKAFSGADVIFVTVPAMLMKSSADLIIPNIRPGVKIGLVPGTGGGECAFRECLEKGAAIFCLQRVPSVARLVEYGKTVRAVGYRREIFVAALPHSETETCRAFVESVLGIRTLPLPNYLNATLTPSNPILHTTRLYNLYKDYHSGFVYRSVPLFYEDWNRETSELLLLCDNEVQKLCAKLDHFDLSFVKSLRVHYESKTADAMTKKISGIEGFRGLKSPAAAVEGGYIPDFSSRYFTADFSFGLTILIQIARFVGLDTPNMQKVWDWYHKLFPAQKEFQFSDYGIHSYQDFEQFYSV